MNIETLRTLTKHLDLPYKHLEKMCINFYIFMNDQETAQYSFSFWM